MSVALQKAKARRLIAELEKLSKRQELERAQRELEHAQSDLTLKQQLFEQQCEVEEAALEESVWQQATKEDTDTTNKSTIVHVQCKLFKAYYYAWLQQFYLSKRFSFWSLLARDEAASSQFGQGPSYVAFYFHSLFSQISWDVKPQSKKKLLKVNLQKRN